MEARKRLCNGDEALKGFPTPTEVISESESVKSGKATCEVITGFESMVFSMIDIMYNISLQDESVYYALSNVSREFAFEYVLPLNASFKAHFGYSVENYANCTRYLKHGLPHRRDGPAEIYRDPVWRAPMIYDETPSELPTFENDYGLIYAWMLNGEPHRDNEGIAVYYASGQKERYRHGNLHAINFPAWERADGTEYWYCDGEPHRDDDLPATILPDGTVEYFINGEEVYYDNFGVATWVHNGENVDRFPCCDGDVAEW